MRLLIAAVLLLSVIVAENAAPVLNAFGKSVRTPNTAYRSILGDPG
jgi:hypothetical protein